MVIEKLSEFFSRFPGIGSRQARRFVYFLLHLDDRSLNEFLDTIKMLRESVHQCGGCYRYFEGNDTLCVFCDKENASGEILMVVEKDVDVEMIHKSGVYNGLYFVLGGLFPIIETKKTSFVRSKELESRVEHEASTNNLREIIFALNANPEGDATVDRLLKNLDPVFKKYSLKITALGRGLSTGTELEYSDATTIKNALQSRR